MSCAIIGRDQIQDILIQQFTDQLSFEKVGPDPIQHIKPHDSSWSPWLGDNDDQSVRDQELPQDVINTIETQSIGNSVDRYIKSGYQDAEIDDEEYLSDDSLKEFLKKLGELN